MTDISVKELCDALATNGTALQDCMYILTGVNLLQRDVLLQLSTQFNLCPILPTCTIITQDEMRVAAVENSKLAQGVGHCLVRSGHLKKKKFNSASSK